MAQNIDLGDVKGFAKVINQRHGKPSGMIPGDRASVLGNPFEMGHKEALRDKVCDAHTLYFKRVIGGEEPVAVANEIAQEQGLSLAKAWKRPTREAYMAELERIDSLVAQGGQVEVGCWCAGQGRCHLDRLAQDWNRDRALALVKDQEIELPEHPFAISTREEIMTTTAPSEKRDDIVLHSGGQTGADMGGLLGAEALGIPTGGVAPHGWLVEKCDRYPNGRNPELGTRFGLIEGPKGSSIAETYRLRTKMNIEGAEGTAIFGSAKAGQDPGTYLTLKLCEQLEKPWIHFELDELNDPVKAGAELRQWLIDENIRVVNVAGNRESRYPGLEDKVSAIIQEATRERLPEKGLAAQAEIAPPQVAPIPKPTISSLQCYCHLGNIEPAHKESAVSAIAGSVKAIVQKAVDNGHQGASFSGNAAAIPVVKNAVEALESTIIVSVNHAPMANINHLREGDVLLLVAQNQAQEKSLIAQATQLGIHVLGYDCAQKGYFNNKQTQQMPTAHLNGKGGIGR